MSALGQGAKQIGVHFDAPCGLRERGWNEQQLSTMGVTTDAATHLVTRRREAAPPALALELDAGQPSRARSPAADGAHSFDF